MANDKKNNLIEYIIIAAIVICAIIVAIIYLSIAIIPVLFLILYIYNQMSYFLKDRLRSYNRFWLTSGEKEYFKQVTENLGNAYILKNHVNEAVQNEGIRLNQDGQISQKSYRGRDLRASLDMANNSIATLEPVLDQMRSQPRNTWKKARKHYSNAMGFGISVIAWIIILTMTGNPVHIITEYFDFSTPVDSTITTNIGNHLDGVSISQPSAATLLPNRSIPQDNSYAITIMTNAFFAMIITYFIVKIIGKIIFSIKYKRPPFVDMKNLDSFSGNSAIKKKAKAKSSGSPSETNRASTDNETQCDHTESEQTQESAIFDSWAGFLKKKGYQLSGNWDKWTNCGQWKKLSTHIRIENTIVGLTIEYDIKTKSIYYGITKTDSNDKVSQELLNNDTFKRIIKECGLSVKNNEWWYCLRYSSFDKVFEEYIELINKCTA